MYDRIGERLPQYDLYVRHGVMRLVERISSKVVPIREIRYPGKDWRGLFVCPVKAIGVYLMREEIHLVDELPAI